MIRVSLSLAHVFLWLPMTLNLRKLKKAPPHIRHHLVRMWAILFLKVAKIKVSMRYRNHIPLSTKTLILVEERPFIHECILVALQSECVFYKPRHTPYGLPSAWLDVCSITSLDDIPTYCIMVLDDLTQHDLDVIANQHIQIMKISCAEVDMSLRKPTKISLVCGVPLSAEESAMASLNMIQQL